MRLKKLIFKNSIQFNSIAIAITLNFIFLPLDAFLKQYYVYFLSIRYFIINFILVLNFLKLILVKSVLFLNAFYKYYILTEGFYYEKSKKLIIN